LKDVAGALGGGGDALGNLSSAFLGSGGAGLLEGFGLSFEFVGALLVSAGLHAQVAGHILGGRAFGRGGCLGGGRGSYGKFRLNGAHLGLSPCVV